MARKRPDQIRTQLTLYPPILERGEKLMKLLAFRTFSGFVEYLIREEWERRYGPTRGQNEVEPGPVEPSK